jgi:hypothetical protein
MERAAVLIGVKKTGNLPELQAVTPSVRQMAKWARSQGLDKEHVQVLIDDRGPVNVQQIKNAIKKLVDRSTVEQLIVYFSGHGFNKEGEFWLLSDAPRDPNAAINVEGTIRLARYCGINHVVLISDACRTAAEGLQALQVQGSLVFPNESVSGTHKPVDILYASARGKPSHEVADSGKAATEAVKSFSALYTEVLLEYLNGMHQRVLHRDREDGKEFGVLFLGELADILKKDVPQRLKAKLGGDLKISQYPDDNICRETANAWLARIRFPGRGGRPSRAGRPVIPVSRATTEPPFTVSNALFSYVLEGDLRKWNEVLGVNEGGAEIASLKRAITTYVAPFGPMHFETGCGFKVRGARVVRTVQHDVTVELLDATEGSVIRVSGVPPCGSIVLLVLENGSGAVVPALPDFIAALSFDGGQLIDVSYEPSDNSWRWGEYAAHADELRSLRASIAASAAWARSALASRASSLWRGECSSPKGSTRRWRFTRHTPTKVFNGATSSMRCALSW